MKTQKHGRAAWIFYYSLGTAVVWIPSLSVLGHFVLGFSYNQLFQPVVVIVVVFVCFGPLFVWAQEGTAQNANAFRTPYAVGALFGVAVFILLSVHGRRLGLFDSETAWLIGLTGCFLVVPSGYFLHNKFMLRNRQR